MVLVCVVEPGHVISKSTLERLRTERLQKDDVFQPVFTNTVVFYGANQDEVEFKEDALEALATWGTKTWSFVPGTNHGLVRTGPYVYVHGRTWQPWRVYSDFNGTFMCTFKPGSESTGR